MSPTCATPVETTRKISGVMLSLISAMKPSAKGLTAMPACGQMPPIAAPAAAATRTWTYPLRHNGLEAWDEWEDARV